MVTKTLETLATLVIQERDELLRRWRLLVRELPSARTLDVPTLNDHIPGLLDELAVALRSGDEQSIPETLNDGSSEDHGKQRVKDDFDIEEMAAEYNILRGCIHDLAGEHGLTLQGQPFHILNRVFDHAIGLAMRTYVTQRSLEARQRRAEYLAFVAHDLRTPLNAISLAGRVLELTMSPQASTPDTAQMLKALRRGVQQLEGLVCKILEENMHLDTEVGLALERREFDLWPLVEALIHDLHPVAGGSSTKLINEIPDDMVIYADASLLRRVFQNLIANAIKYTPRGEIVIGARELYEQKAVECWVSDNGSGISAHLLDKVFEKGETDPENTGGTGLGLAIVKAFTEVHAGHVTVESTPGEGTTFRFTLPKKPSA